MSSVISVCDNRLRIASAPRLRPVPQSPSPVMVSYFVMSGSAAMRRERPDCRACLSWEGFAGFVSRLDG